MSRKITIIATGTVALALALALALAAGSPAMAHGVKPTAGSAPKVKKAEIFNPWSFLLHPAEAAARISIDTGSGYRYVRADGIPDHQPGQFPNRGNPHSIKQQNYDFRVPVHPAKTGRITQLGHQNFGIALNGVPFDPLTAEYWNRDRSSGWNVEAMSGAMDLGLDQHNAHVQPNGAYHYHALPTGLIEQFPFREKPALIGYAADGFPIYGPYGYRDPANAGSPVVQLHASYRVKSGNRPSGPGGRYDGTYVQDYEHAPGTGDLDACNGREGVTPEFPGGTYHYVITAEFPFIPRCWVGTPDGTFALRGPGGAGGGPGAGPGGSGLPHEMGPPGGGAPGMTRPSNMGPPSGGSMGGGFGRPGFGPQGGMGQGGGFGGPQGGRMGGGPGGGPGGGMGGPPDLNAAAERLGISVQELHQALGPPPPDFDSAAKRLGISRDKLFQALHPGRQ
jgi:hypothetical protein